MNKATDKRWFVVPKYRGDGTVDPEVTVTNAAGELVAVFQDWGEAENVVAMHNEATGRKAA